MISLTRFRAAAPRAGAPTLAALLAVALLAACSSSSTSSSSSGTTGTQKGGPGPVTQGTTTGTATRTAAVSGNQCPCVVDQSKADFYPIQPSFSAGYTMSVLNLNSTTAPWAYVVEADFPYSNWMAWYLYNEKGVPLYKFSDTAITPDAGSTNPFVVGNPVLAPTRHFHLYLMPSTTPANVVSSMQGEGKNVALLPAVGSTDAVSIVSRSYWSFANDGLGSYDRFGYGGPTNTPYPAINAFTVDASTGALTNTPVGDCGAQSVLPQAVWYDVAAGKPIITFENASPPADGDTQDLPKFLVQTGSAGGSLGKEFPPSPVPDEVQFYRNVASSSPYADVQSAPAAGNPPDACGGYVMANLPNDVVSVIRIPQVPTYPDYSGATAATLNESSNFQVQFYSVVIYGAEKQLDAYGTNENSQIGNKQIQKDADGGATVVLYPRSATSAQVERIAAVAKANGWNLLKSGLQTAVAPNLLTIREKGQNKTWANALSANEVTQGAPCPQSTNPSLPLPQDPPSAAVNQTNGMGLTAPSGQNCGIEAFLSGACLDAFQARLKQSGWAWSVSGAWPTQRSA